MPAMCLNDETMLWEPPDAEEVAEPPLYFRSVSCNPVLYHDTEPKCFIEGCDCTLRKCRVLDSPECIEAYNKVLLDGDNLSNRFDFDASKKQRKSSVQFEFSQSLEDNVVAETETQTLDEFLHDDTKEEVKKERRNSVQFQDEDDTYVFSDSELENQLSSNKRDSLYSVEEHDEELDENENSTKTNKNLPEAKPNGGSKKRFSFKSLFRKDKDPKTPPSENTLRRKYSSALDITSKPLKRSSSFLNSKLNDGKQFLKRSLSFRDLKIKRRDSDKKHLSEKKNLEWVQSLQSLQENDNSVSYNDLSFVNYDQFNSYSYNVPEMPKKTDNSKIWRTQSMLVSGSSSLADRKAVTLTRGSSIATHIDHDHHRRHQNHQQEDQPQQQQQQQHRRSTSVTDYIPEYSGAVSLPSLHHLNQENAEISAASNPERSKYRRRPQSTNSDDGRIRPSSNGSFRSAGNGCAKLKRHNACRQKSRNSSTTSLQPLEDDSVRSRSLNHLDTLEMRQGVAPGAATSNGGVVGGGSGGGATAMKDARSEPDCTRPLLMPPSPSLQPHAADLGIGIARSPSPPHRRHMLSRSQKSSSECFSVNFEVGDEAAYDTEFFFPATRGLSLHEALTKQCELRNIELPSCDAWLSDREGNTHTWLSLSQDTACLVGKHIRITPKDASRTTRLLQTHSRKPSTNYRPRTSSFFSSSTEDASSLSINTIPDTDLKKQTKRWSGLFGNNKDTKSSMDQLSEQLDYYTKHGIPTCQVYALGQSESSEALYNLEEDWRYIIRADELTEKQQKQQTALWELIKTEVAYIKTLKVVTDLFLACLLNLQQSNLLKEVDTDKLFSNINDILDANVQFWRNSLYPLLRDMRVYGRPACVETMCEGFLRLKEDFQAYYKFCGDQSRCQHYCREIMTHNELFRAYLAWCEAQKECNRLRLMDIIVQPMQRLTKYGLLLKAILKNTEDEVEHDDLELMIKSVDDFVNNVNSSLRQKQDNERLKGIIARIESYDIVETKDDDLERLLKSYNHLDLNKPMLNCPPERKRHLLLEGDLKFKDSATSKMEVHCFLLTDMLLVCKSSTKKGGATMKVIRQPYLVDRLVVHEINREKETPTLACIYKNEFDMAVAAFLLQNNDANKLKSWKDGLVKAQNLYAQARQSEESLDTEYSFDYAVDSDYHCLQLAPRSPMATSSRASRVSSLAHSHSGSVEMNDQSSIGSNKDQSRAVSVENDNRTASVSSDEGVQPIPPDKSPVSQQKGSFKHRLFNKTPNTLSVQPCSHGLGQSLPNLALGSPNTGTTLTLNLGSGHHNNTLSVPSGRSCGGSQLLSPTHRGVSYPPPSPTRANLRRGMAITQNKNPPLIKTRHVISSTSTTAPAVPSSFDFDVPVIAGVPTTEQFENFSRGQHRQAKRIYRNDNKRYYTAGAVDDIKRNDAKDASIHKRLSWNCGASSQDCQPSPHDQQQSKSPNDQT